MAAAAVTGHRSPQRCRRPVASQHSQPAAPSCCNPSAERRPAAAAVAVAAAVLEISATAVPAAAVAAASHRCCECSYASSVRVSCPCEMKCGRQPMFSRVVVARIVPCLAPAPHRVQKRWTNFLALPIVRFKVVNRRSWRRRCTASTSVCLGRRTMFFLNGSGNTIGNALLKPASILCRRSVRSALGSVILRFFL